MTSIASTDTIAQVSSLATHYSLTIWSLGSDFLILIVTTLFFIFFARSVGRGQLVAVLLSFYCAYALYATFPYVAYLPTAPALTALLSQVAVYFGLVFIFYIILVRVVVSDFLSMGLIGMLLLSFLATGFLVALAYHVFPVSTVYHFTPAVDMFFAAKTYFWWWFIAPAVGLFFLAR